MSKLVAIVNVTPDSFSDGGKYSSAKAAIAIIRQLIKDGADVIDIGAESTRPGASAISPEEEWERLEPVLLGVRHLDVPISIDTRHGETARKALGAGAHWINDVSGLSSRAMINVVRDSDCLLVVMHSLTIPPTRDKVLPKDVDPITLLMDWAEERFAALEKSGIGRHRLIFDPGIGFGKTPEQSLAILRHVHRFRALNVPILIGHSRKSFLGDTDRDAATLKISQGLAAQGIEYLRVHDIAAHKKAL